MDQADQREELFTNLGENFEELDEILDEKIQANVDLQGPDGPEKVAEAKGMEANIAEVGTWLGNYLRTPREEYKQCVFDDTEDFREELNRFKNLNLTEEEQGWVVELEDLFNQTQAFSTEMIALDAAIAMNLAEFVDLRTELDAILDDEIQVLTHQDLAEAAQVAHQMESRTNLLVLLLLLVGLATGAIVAVGITRDITGPVGKLASASQAIARGDLSQRVDVQSKDEFGILGQSFNVMIAERQQANEELEVRVQDRTLELAKAREELVDSRRRVMTVSEGLRRDIAQQLHGTVQNKLIVVQQLMGQLTEKSEMESTRDELSKLNEIITDLIQNDVRGISQQLYPAVLRRGLIPALISLFSGMEPALRVERQLSEDLQSREAARRDFIPLTTRLAAYRIAEDALTNVIKHSETSAATIHLELDREDQIRLTIRDQGNRIS